MIGEIVNSRYQVLEAFPDDGWGTAWLAEDSLGGGPLVLRVVRAPADQVQLLRHAFRLRAGTRHPNLAQAFDTGAIVGTEDQFFTSEHVAGRDLFAASEGWDEARIVAIAGQLLRAIACLHGRGVVGIDLRCESIRVVGDEAKLLDVGLSSPDREVEGVPIRGPLGLPPPERLLEGPEDPRSDLWSLGVALYRVAARRAPFEGEGLSLLREALRSEPAPLARVSTAFSQFVARLLSRSPGDRPSSANEAIRLLSRAAGQELEVEPAVGAVFELPRDPMDRIRPSLDRALAVVGAALEGRSDAPSLLVLRGGAGAGKSRLIAELRLAARLMGAVVAEGACRDGLDAPSAPFQTIFRDTIATRQPPSPWLAAPAPDEAPYRPSLGMRTEESEGVFGAPAERDRLRRAHRQALLAVDLARERPLLLVVEDAQWADPSAIEAVRHLARTMVIAREESSSRPLRMLVVVATRGPAGPFGGVKGEVVELDPVARGDKELSRIPSRTERHILDVVSALRAEASAGLLALASGLDVDAVIEALCSLERRGIVERRGARFRVARHSAREEAYAELDAKRREALHRALARAIESSKTCVPGLAEHFDRGGLADRAIEEYLPEAWVARQAANPALALGTARRALELAQGAMAKRKRVLETLGAMEAWCGDARSAIPRFEDALKDSTLTPSDRVRVLVRLTEAALETGDVERAFAAASEAHAHMEAVAAPGDRAAVVAVLAQTLAERGEADAAISGARKMLDQLPKGAADVGVLALRMALAGAYRARGDRSRAISELEGCLTWARRQNDGGASLGAVLSELADLHAAVGDHVRGLQCLAEALEAAGKAQDLPAMWRAHVAMVALHARQGSTDLAGVHLAEAERLARRIGSPQALGYVHGALGGIALDADRPAAALAHFEKAIQVAEAAGAAGQKARHLSNVGVALWRLGRHEEAEGAFRQGAEAGTAAKEWAAVVRCQAKLAEMAVSLGMLAEGSQAARRASETAEREGMPREAARARGILAEAELLAGRADEAASLAAAAAGVWREARVARRLCPVLSTLSRALAEAGRHDEALAAADEAIRHLDRVGVRAVRAGCLVAKARVLLARAAAGPPERRGELLSQALPLAREAAQIAGSAGWSAHLAVAQVRLAQRDSAAARESVDRAASVCREEASKIPPRMAEAFLARRDVREALDLAASLAQVAPSTSLAGDERARFLDLLRVTRDLTRERDLETLLRSITDNVIRLFRADRGLLILADDGQLRCKVARTSDGQGIPFSDARVEDGVVEAVLRGSTALVARDTGGRAVACLPLSVHERALGVLYLEGETFAEADLEVMAAFASGAAIAIENANLYGQTIVDDFTGLKSHRYFMLRLREEVRRARRLERPVALVLIDVDRLKLVNDIHGPEGGNTVILGVAQILQDLLRQDDTMVVAPKRVGGEKVVGRIEGGKFELLLPDTDSAGGAAMAERILERVRAIAFSMGKAADAPKALVTASAGVAAYPIDAPEADQLALKAGEAMYTAKRNGRDRVFAYGAEAGGRDDAARKGSITDPDFDSIALSRDGRTFMGMVSRVLDCGLDLEKMLEVALKLVVDVTGAERGIILLREPGGFLRPRCTHAIPYEELEGKGHAVSYTLVRQVAKAGQPVLIRNTALDANVKDQASVLELSLKSILCAPIALKEEVIGVFYVDTTALDREFTEEHLSLLMAFARKIGSPLQASCLHQWHAEETRMLRRALDELGTKYSYDQIVGVSKPMQDMFKLLDKITPTQFPVLIHGESGTGKELVARAIHFNGPRKGKPFVAENCAALPETLLESELFGHVKGAFTGADRDKKGLFELASGGTLFLDEVGDMGPEMQKALLRVLQEGEIRPVGGKGSVKVDVRIIAATHRKLEEMAKQGKFREDLFYRLNVIGISIPPLRERKEDIPYLVHHFLEMHAKGTPHPERNLERGAMEALVVYDWPGNIRELENEVKKLVAMGEKVIGPDILSPQIRKGTAPAKERAGGTRVTRRIAPRATLDDIEKDAITQSLKEHDWNVRATARALGIDRMALTRRIEKYGIEVPDKPKKTV